MDEEMQKRRDRAQKAGERKDDRQEQSNVI